MANPIERKRLKKKMLDRWENEGGRIGNEQQFLEQAELAKTNCIVSQALRGIEIRLQARLGEAVR